MVGNGARGFTYTSVAVPIDFVGTPLTIDTSRLSDADADQVLDNAGLADIVAFADRKRTRLHSRHKCPPPMPSAASQNKTPNTTTHIQPHTLPRTNHLYHLLHNITH